MGPGSRAVEVPVIVIAVVVTAAVISALRHILSPLALAFFLMVGIDALARWIRRRAPAMPNRVAVIISMVVVLAAAAVGVMVLANGARTLMADARNFGPRLDALDAHLAQRFGMPPPPPVRTLLREAHLGGRVLGFARTLEGAAAAALFVMVYLVFLFASRAAYGAKVRRLSSRAERVRQILRAGERIREGVETYILLQGLTALILAGASFALMLAVGLNNAPFWAFLVFIASFIPVLGGAVSIFLPPLFALMQFDTQWQALALIGGGEAIHMFIGNVVAPRLQGSRLNLDPLVVVLSLVFWDTIWGMPGAFMSTPLTVTAVVVLSQFKGARWVAVLMSRDGEPEQWSSHHPEPESVTQA
jgi:predicted PurR-regulated permease PerM